MTKKEINIKKTNVITFANMKGGVGKTTSAINIAAYLGRLGHKVLIIDCDYQANASASLNLLKEGIHTRRNLYEGIVSNKRRFKDCILSTEFKNLDMVTSKFQLYYFSIMNDLNSESVLKAWLTKATFNKYDYIIVDSRPELGTLFSNVMMITDFVVVPLLIEPDSIMGLSIILHHLAKSQRYKKDLRLLGVLYSMVDSKYAVHKNFKPTIDGILEEKGISSLGIIPASGAVKNAAAQYKPVLYSHVKKSELPVQKAFRKVTSVIVSKVLATTGRATVIPTIPISEGEDIFMSVDDRLDQGIETTSTLEF